MTYNDLTDLLNASITDGVLRLDLSVDEDLAAFATDYFVDAVLVMELPDQYLPIGYTNQPITLYGTGGNFPFTGLPVVAVFDLDESQNLCFTLADDTRNAVDSWILSDRFTNFLFSVYDDIPYAAGTRLILKSSPSVIEMDEGQVEMDPGIFLEGSIRLDQMPGGIAGLMGLSTIGANGYIDLTTGGTIVSDLEIFGKSTEEIDIGIGRLEGVLLTITYQVFEEDDDASSDGDTSVAISPPFPFFSLSSVVRVFLEDKLYDLPVSMMVFNTDHLTFEIEVDQLVQAGADALSVLAGGLNLQDFLPPSLSLDRFIQLAYISLDWDSSSSSVNFLRLTVQNRTPVVVPSPGMGSGVLTLDNIVLKLTVDQPFGDPSGAVSGTCSITLGDAGQITLTADFTEIGTPGGLQMHYYGYLSGPVPLSLPHLMRLLTGSDAGVPLIDITGFSLTVDAVPGEADFQYAISLRASDDWPIGSTTLSVENLSMNIASDPRLFLLSGTFDISNFVIGVTAEYSGADGAWVFSGQADMASQTNIGEDVTFSIGYLVSELAYFFGISDESVPSFIASMLITDIAVRFNTLTHDFSFACTVTDTPVEGGPLLTMAIGIEIVRQNDGSYRKTFTGQLFVEASNGNASSDENGSSDEQAPSDAITLNFDLIFSLDPNEQVLLGTFTNVNQTPVQVRSLLTGLLGAGEAPQLPESLVITPRSALFAWRHDAAQGSRVLFCLDLAASINLSSLPELLAAELPPNQTASLAFLTMVASGDFMAEELEAFNALLPEASAAFPPPPPGLAAGAPQVASGLDLQVTLQLGDFQYTFDIPASLNPFTSQIELGASDGFQPQPIWFNLQKALGPLYIGRVGFLYSEGTISLFLDATLNTGGLSIALDGFSISTPVADLSPSFNLNGLAVDYGAAGLEVNAALLRQRLNGADIYNGTASLRLETLELALLGSYTTYQGHPSLFIYGVVNSPIGGMPALFVTGLSAGFGYNRKLVPPDIGSLLQFPLVAEAMGTRQSASSLEAEMEALTTYIPPALGMYWAAAGVKFTTYKLLDSFAMVAVSAGKNLRLDVMGTSTALMPPQSSGNLVLAELQLALMATVDLSEGVAAAKGQLTENAFILSRNARITGGFALSFWFAGAHAHDFVLTAGGYHPQFSIPSHYPQSVPRLGLNWQIDSRLTVKGGLYFALTPGYMMAGGDLQMTWTSDSLVVSFSAGAHFLMAWKPFHYTASTSIQISAALTIGGKHCHHTSVFTAGAKLDLWGPDFSGKARIEVSHFSKTVTFGVASKATPQPISWTEFQDSFLPEHPLSFRFLSGQAGATGNQQHIVVNPSALRLAIDTAIPVNQFLTGAFSGEIFTPEGTHLLPSVVGIAPMGVAPEQTGSQLQLEIDTTLFDVTYTYSPVSAALWGSSLLPSVTSPALTAPVVTGVVIRPKPAQLAENAFSVAADVYACETVSGNPLTAWRNSVSFSYDSNLQDDTPAFLNANIMNETVATMRDQLMELMGIDTPVNLNATWADMFMETPVLILYMH